MSFGSRFSDVILKHAFSSGAAMTRVTTAYVSLTTTDPGAAGNAGAGEPTSAGSYARVAVTFPTDFTFDINANLGRIYNTGVVAFAESTAAWSTGASTLGFFGLWDHLTNTAEANFIGSGTITTPRAVNAAGITLRYAAAALTITLD